jgi:peptidoglycan/LPS O-acetylase OafA/YrhL
MAHYPVNHHLRQTYRFLAFLAGAYLLVTGVIGVATTWGDSFFNRGHDWSLGLRINPAAAWLLAILGLIIVGATLAGGNVHQQVALILGWGLCGLAMVIMATMQTDANAFNASMINVLVLVVLGLVLLTAGLFGKVGSVQAARAEEAAAHPR